MGGVDAHLQRLEPVALHEALEGEGVGTRRDKAVELREGGRVVPAKVGEEDAVALAHRVAGVEDAGKQAAALGLGGGFQAFPLHVEQPAVEHAAQAAVLQPAKSQVRAPMRTVPLQQAMTPPLVAEKHQLLAHHPHRRQGPFRGKLFGQGDRLPIFAQQLPRGRAWANPGHAVVCFGAHHRKFSPHPAGIAAMVRAPRTRLVAARRNGVIGQGVPPQARRSTGQTIIQTNYSPCPAAGAICRGHPCERRRNAVH